MQVRQSAPIRMQMNIDVFILISLAGYQMSEINMMLILTLRLGQYIALTVPVYILIVMPYMQYIC